MDQKKSPNRNDEVDMDTCLLRISLENLCFPPLASKSKCLCLTMISYFVGFKPALSLLLGRTGASSLVFFLLPHFTSTWTSLPKSFNQKRDWIVEETARRPGPECAEAVQDMLRSMEFTVDIMENQYKILKHEGYMISFKVKKKSFSLHCRRKKSENKDHTGVF